MAFKTTRTATTLRVWFPITRNGQLVTGLLPGAFTVTVVDAADAASSSPAVAESSTKAGVYFYDLPSAFLITNGVGEYVGTVEVSSTGPFVRTVIEDTIKVTLEDVDSLTTSATDEAQANVAHDDLLGIMTIAAWLDRSGQIVTSPTSATITLRDQTNAIVAGPTVSAAPFATGIFIFIESPVFLNDDQVYNLEVSVTDTIGTVVSNQSINAAA